MFNEFSNFTAQMTTILSNFQLQRNIFANRNCFMKNVITLFSRRIFKFKEQLNLTQDRTITA